MKTFHPVLCSALLIAISSTASWAAQSTSIIIDTPRGGEVYAPGQQQTVVLNAKTRAASVLIELSRDGGATFETLGTVNNKVKGLADRNRLTWIASFPATTNGIIRATSTDAHHPGKGVSGTFTIVLINADGSTTDPRYVQKSGDTMTGPLVMNADPTANLQAATKQYVDSSSTTATSQANAQSQAYTDARIATEGTARTNADALKVSKSGDTMTGPLVLPANGITIGASQLSAVGGNVGIGTSTPGGPLEVFGNWNGQGALRISGDKPTIKFLGSPVSGNQDWILHLGADGPGNLEFFRVTGPGPTLANVLTLAANGKVGVNTTAPSSTLTVNGQIEVATIGNGLKFPDGSVQTTAASSATLGYPKCRVFNSTSVSIATSTATVLSFDSESFNSNNNHSTTINPSRLTCQTAGTYLIGGQVVFATNGNGSRLADIKLNGATVIASQKTLSATSSPAMVHVVTLYQLNVGDYVELEATQSSGGGLNVQAGSDGPIFWMTQLP